MTDKERIKFIRRIKELRKIQGKANTHHISKYAWVVIACNNCRETVGVWSINLKTCKCPFCEEKMV